MRTPVWRATASSASFRGTPSSISVTVRSKGDAAAACCDRTGAVTATSNPANGIRNRMVGLLRLRSPTRGGESRRPPGPSPAGVDHLGERRESFVDGAGGERDGEPVAGCDRAAHRDIHVVPALELRHDLAQGRIVEHESAAGPPEVVSERDARRRAQHAVRVEHATIARPQAEHRVVPPFPGPQGDPPGRHHDLEVVVLRVRTHVEAGAEIFRSEEHTSELQSPYDLVCRLLLEKKNRTINRLSLRYIL